MNDQANANVHITGNVAAGTAVAELSGHLVVADAFGLGELEPQPIHWNQTQTIALKVRPGTTAWVEDEQKLYQWTGSIWKEHTSELAPTYTRTTGAVVAVAIAAAVAVAALASSDRR